MSTIRYLVKCIEQQFRGGTRGVDLHFAAVEFANEGFEIGGGAEFTIQLGDIYHPISVVGVAISCSRTFVVFMYRTYPNC